MLVGGCKDGRPRGVMVVKEARLGEASDRYREGEASGSVEKTGRGGRRGVCQPAPSQLAREQPTSESLSCGLDIRNAHSTR